MSGKVLVKDEIPQSIPASPFGVLKRPSAKIETAVDTKQIGSLLVGDVIVGTTVTFFVAPFLTIVDKAVVQSAAGTHTILQSGVESIKGIVSKPVAYYRSPTFLLMWAAYAATYSTANCLKTLSSEDNFPAKPGTPGSSSAPVGKAGVFMGTTIANSGASMFKDQAYAKMFGTQAASKAVPKLTYGFWMLRDTTVVGSSFILPELVTGPVARTFDLEYKAARDICQLTMPIVMQVVAGPLHLIGLDLFNRDLSHLGARDALVDRARQLYRGCGPVILARTARIAPGYSFGGVFNTRLRDSWQDMVAKTFRK